MRLIYNLKETIKRKRKQRVEKTEIEKRANAIKGGDSCKCTDVDSCKCTDVDRIIRNKKAISEIIEDKEKLASLAKDKLANFILDNVKFLYTEVTEQPVEEFMNLNAFKTAFSISDQVRANLISLNSIS